MEQPVDAGTSSASRATPLSSFSLGRISLQAPSPGSVETASSRAPSRTGAATGGTPLAAEERAFFEPRFGQSLEHVRIHTGASADQSARGMGARAYTLGSDIVFARGQYAPGTSAGRRVLAHELTHVLQQSGGSHLGAMGPAIHAAPFGQPQCLSWEEIRNSAYEGLISGLRSARRAGISALRAGVARLDPSMHSFANVLVDVVDAIAEILTALILAVVGIVVGFGAGIVEAVIGLISLVTGIIEGLIRWLWSVFTLNPTHFNQWAARVGATIEGIPAALRQAVNQWLREFETASAERQTLMIGELTGRVLAIIATIYVTGNLPPSLTVAVPVPALTTTGQVVLTTAEVAVPLATPVGVVATGPQILMMAGRGDRGDRRPPQQQAPPPRPRGPLNAQSRPPYTSGWLNAHEAAGPGERLFRGHTLAHHVAKTLQQLRERLTADPRLARASTYTNAAEAERLTELAMSQNWARIEQWLASPWSELTENLTFTLPLRGQQIGITLARGAATGSPGNAVTVQLIRLQAADGSWTFFVNTSFPAIVR